MSDHTTEATDHVPAGVESGNPSMEDILASIRRIIADDDAQVTDSPEIDAIEANLDIKAAASPDSDTLDALILDVDTDTDDTTVLDLEDILILEEDDFGDDVLEIPDVDMLEQTLTDPLVVEPDTVSFADDGLLDIDSILESSLDDMDIEILDTPAENPTVSVPEIVVQPDEVERPADLETLDDIILEDMIVEIASPEPVTVDEALSDDIFSTLDSGLDLVLEDGSAPGSPEPEVPSTPEVAAVLNVIDENISAIEVPENERELAAIEIENLLDGDDTTSDSIDDFMSSFLLDEDETPQPLDLTMDDVSEPELTDITDDTDIELVKSLMADLTDEDLLSEPTTQDALITPEVTPAKLDTSDLDTPEQNIPDSDPLIDIGPKADTIDDVLDDIFALAIEDEILTQDDMGVESLTLETLDEESPEADREEADIESVDASISSLLKIAAEAEEDAQATDSVAEPLPELIPEVLDVMPTQDSTLQDDLAAIEAESEIEDIDSLFSDSLISAVEASKPQPIETLADFEPAPTPSLAIEALAAQSFSLDDLLDDTETPEVSDAIDAMTTPETSDIKDALPAPSVDEAILPEPDDASNVEVVPETAQAAPLVLPDPEPVSKDPKLQEALVAQIASEPSADQEPKLDANPTIDIAPTAAGPRPSQSREALTPEKAPTPEKEDPEMTKAAANESILDEVTESAASGAFASLTDLVEAQTEFEESGPRIGDLVQEALRPMLKEWLDENLKGIVERTVQKEVKRIASGK